MASPINWGEDGYTEEPSPVEVAENQKRPSVLVCVQGGKLVPKSHLPLLYFAGILGKSKEISNDEIQGAMALVEMKNGLNCNYSYRI